MKSQLKAFMERQTVSRAVTAAARPLARWVPDSVLYRIPVSGLCTVRVPGSNGTFRIQVGPLDSISTAVYWHGLEGYEAHTMRALIAMAGRLASFVDVGANVGIYSLLLAATNPSMPVHAVEPVPAIFARLRRNAELNGFPTLWLHQVAASDSTGETVIHVPTNQAVPIEASLVAGFRPETTTVPVQAITIDALVSQAGIPEVGLLKVDTEGATRRVLDGAVATLCRDAPFVICEILSGWDNGEGLGQMMADLGYQAYRLAARGPERVERVRGDPTYADLNFLFVHRDRTGEVPSRW